LQLVRLLLNHDGLLLELSDTHLLRHILILRLRWHEPHDAKSEGTAKDEENDPSEEHAAATPMAKPTVAPRILGAQVVRQLSGDAALLPAARSEGADVLERGALKELK
jgi:hypothetical protein